jgi:hypothetical protein
MSLERIISQFGNPALIAGLLLESETVLDWQLSWHIVAI